MSEIFWFIFVCILAVGFFYIFGWILVFIAESPRVLMNTLDDHKKNVDNIKKTKKKKIK